MKMKRAQSFIKYFDTNFMCETGNLSLKIVLKLYKNQIHFTHFHDYYFFYETLSK